MLIFQYVRFVNLLRRIILIIIPIRYATLVNLAIFSEIIFFIHAVLAVVLITCSFLFSIRTYAIIIVSISAILINPKHFFCTIIIPFVIVESLSCSFVGIIFYIILCKTLFTAQQHIFHDLTLLSRITKLIFHM